MEKPISKFPFAREAQKCTKSLFPLLAPGPKIEDLNIRFLMLTAQKLHRLNIRFLCEQAMLAFSEFGGLTVGRVGTELRTL